MWPWWRQPVEEYKDKCVLPTVKHGGNVMVRGRISAAGTGELQFIEGTMNANMYCDILKQSMIPSLCRLGHRVQHPASSMITTTVLLKKLRIKVNDWPITFVLTSVRYCILQNIEKYKP